MEDSNPWVLRHEQHRQVVLQRADRRQGPAAAKRRRDSERRPSRERPSPAPARAPEASVVVRDRAPVESARRVCHVGIQASGEGAREPSESVDLAAELSTVVEEQRRKIRDLASQVKSLRISQDRGGEAAGMELEDAQSRAREWRDRSHDAEEENHVLRERCRQLAERKLREGATLAPLRESEVVRRRRAAARPAASEEPPTAAAPAHAQPVEAASPLRAPRSTLSARARWMAQAEAELQAQRREERVAEAERRQAEAEARARELSERVMSLEAENSRLRRLAEAQRDALDGVLSPDDAAAEDNSAGDSPSDGGAEGEEEGEDDEWDFDDGGEGGGDAEGEEEEEEEDEFG